MVLVSLLAAWRCRKLWAISLHAIGGVSLAWRTINSPLRGCEFDSTRLFVLGAASEDLLLIQFPHPLVNTAGKPLEQLQV